LPYHLRLSGIGWLAVAIVFVAVTVGMFAGGLRGPAISATVADDAVVRGLNGIHLPGFVGAMRAFAAIGSWWVLNILSYGVLVALLVFRRFRHLIIMVILANLLGFLAADVLGTILRRPRPFGVAIQAGWGGWALPSVQIMFLAGLLVAILYTLVPDGRWRNAGKWVAAALVAAAALGRVALGADAPTDVLVGAALGVTVPLVAYRVLCPNEAFPIRYRRGRTAHLDVGGRRGAAIRQALQDRLGLAVAAVDPFGQEFSASCTPLRITLEADPPVHAFAKLYARSHLRADRWYKLGRELLYGRLEDEASFKTVRHLVEHEDYALRLLRDVGLPVPRPLGTVELTPEREYLVVTEFLEDAVEVTDVQIDDDLIDQGLRIVRTLWDAGLAHRDIKPANLLVRQGRLHLIDVMLTEVHPTPWRQVIDLANMLLVLALLSDAERVHERARRVFTDEEIAEAFAARQGRAMPAQIRQMLRASPRDQLAEFGALLPVRPRPIALQRWTLRRVASLAFVLVVALLAVPVMTGAFNNDLAVRTPVYVGDLGCSRLEPLWLQAQAVPSASLVPCLRPLPTGWGLGGVTVNDGRSVITLHHDRAGVNALVARLSADCDITGLTEVPSKVPGVRRFETAQTLQAGHAVHWFDRFQGGCVSYRLQSIIGIENPLKDEASMVFGFATRQMLRRALEARTAGRQSLDPAETK
jgi:tRNA A-37 threonylcarbamoyl transferase component Bud32